MDSSGSGQVHILDCCDHSNEHLSSTESEEFLV